MKTARILFVGLMFLLCAYGVQGARQTIWNETFYFSNSTVQENLTVYNYSQIGDGCLTIGAIDQHNHESMKGFGGGCTGYRLAQTGNIIKTGGGKVATINASNQADNSTPVLQGVLRMTTCTGGIASLRYGLANKVSSTSGVIDSTSMGPGLAIMCGAVGSKVYTFNEEVSVATVGESAWVPFQIYVRNFTERAYWLRINGTDYMNSSNWYHWPSSDTSFENITYEDGGNAAYDLFVSNLTMDIDASSGPTISALNCTSCNPPAGDTTPPYTTSDTTPTFTFTTATDADCRISAYNVGYSAMNSTRDCAGGQAGQAHTCSLPSIDELYQSTSYMYATCLGILGGETASGSLQIELTDLATQSADAIESGIQHSRIWPDALLYLNQPVYLRSSNNSQVYATVDVVAARGNQRWIFNHAEDSEALAGLTFNITPIVYVWDKANLTLAQIEQQVSALINSTMS